ncbi:unnamed protein product [Rotaria sp. Silwood1]|nr:unnamed protein product [Rotaria sp. Silwood1]
MDDIDLRYLDTKSLHAMFQRDPFKILARMAKEGGYDFPKALKKWDIEEHGHLTYSIYVIDFPSAVKGVACELALALTIKPSALALLALELINVQVLSLNTIPVTFQDLPARNIYNAWAPYVYRGTK